MFYLLLPLMGSEWAEPCLQQTWCYLLVVQLKSGAWEWAFYQPKSCKALWPLPVPSKLSVVLSDLEKPAKDSCFPPILRGQV